MTRPRAWLWGAATAGGLHASFSLYWALGGCWLLDTVGQWAVRLAADHPVGAGAGLAAVALVKVLGAALPLVWAAGRLWPRRVWAWLFQGGAVVLIAYGVLNVAVAWAVLGGLVGSSAEVDRRAQLGHAALWDPLFLVWGMCLLVGVLLASRDARGAGSR